MNGRLIISLDFELMWGVFDKRTIQNYGESIENVRIVIPRLLDLLHHYDVKATFATVGFLFAKDKAEVELYAPSQKPTYIDKKLSAYTDYLLSIGKNENEDKYHYASSMIEMIKNYPQHEIGTHTFCHYYCLEEGQTSAQFEADLKAAINIVTPKGVKIESIVFPRNQINEKYLQICYDNGIRFYRGNEPSWIYQPRSGKEESRLRRMVRLMDAYINISGHNTYPVPERIENNIVNIPASRFLRPYSPKLSFLESLRLNRIKGQMKYAAKHNTVFHLWWHPHNFGKNLDSNFLFLAKVLEHFKYLNEHFKFQSTTMNNIYKNEQ